MLAQSCSSAPADGRPVNADLRDTLARAAGASTPEETLRRIEAVLACREAMIDGQPHAAAGGRGNGARCTPPDAAETLADADGLPT